MNYLAFDIETAKITADGNNLEAERPLGICCWATAFVVSGQTEIVTGHGFDDDGNPSSRMSIADCAHLVWLLQKSVNEFGFTLLTHNGVGFDLDILAEESRLHAECVELAMNSVDTMLQFHCMKGFPVGLDAIAKGMGLSGKTEGMSGSLAPVLWAQGEYEKVLTYVGQDARSTLEVALETEKAGVVRWISKSGKLNAVTLRGWMTVREALKLPLPYTGWMKPVEGMPAPMTREKLTGWMAGARA